MFKIAKKNLTPTKENKKVHKFLINVIHLIFNLKVQKKRKSDSQSYFL